MIGWERELTILVIHSNFVFDLCMKLWGLLIFYLGFSYLYYFIFFIICFLFHHTNGIVFVISNYHSILDTLVIIDCRNQIKKVGNIKSSQQTSHKHRVLDDYIIRTTTNDKTADIITSESTNTNFLVN